MLLSNQIVGFELYNTQTNALVAAIHDGDVIALSSSSMLATLNVRAVTLAEQQGSTVSNDIGSIQITYSQQHHTRTENGTPYSLCGDHGSVYAACPAYFFALNAAVAIAATPYAAPNAVGAAAGPSVPVTFTLTLAAPTAAPAASHPAPVAVAPVAPVARPATAVLPTAASGRAAIAEWRLVYAPTGAVLLTLSDGAVVDLGSLAVDGPDFNIVAVVATASASVVRAVKFSNDLVEGSAPYAYCQKKSAGAFNACSDLTVLGRHTISGRALGVGNANLGVTSITFDIVHTTTTTPGGTAPVAAPPVAVPTPTAKVPVPVSVPAPVAPLPAPVTTPGGTPPSTTTTVAGQWIQVDSSAPISARQEACFLMVNRKAYLLGGRGVKPVDIYDPVARSWSHGPAPPMELHHAQCVAADDKIWLVSPWTGSYPSERTVAHGYVYDTVRRSWSTRTALPIERRRGSATAVLVGRDIYVSHGNIGGHATANSAAVTLGWLDSYNIDTDTWTTNLPDAPNPRDHSGGALIGSSGGSRRLCVAGGRDGGTVGWPTVGPTDCYDVAAQTWSVEAGLPVPRSGASYGRSCDGGLVVAGGEGPNTAYDDVSSFDGTRWTVWPKLDRARQGSGLAVDCRCRQIYLAGGAGGPRGGPLLSTLDTFFGTGVDTQCAA